MKSHIDFDQMDYETLCLAVEKGKIDPIQYGYNTREELLEHFEECWVLGKKNLLNCYLVDLRFSYDFV